LSKERYILRKRSFPVPIKADSSVRGSEPVPCKPPLLDVRGSASFGLGQQFPEHSHIGRLNQVMIEFGLAGVAIHFMLAVAGHGH